MFAILGVSGNTGRAAAERLLERGAAVRVVVRDEAKGQSWREKGAEVAVADLSDTEALRRALRGTQGAYLLNPPAEREPDPLGKAQKQAEIFKQVVGETGRALVLSSIGAQHPDGTGLVRSVHRLEVTIAGVTFLRPAYFLENWAPVLGLARTQGILPSFLQPLDRAVPMVATRDIGITAADLLLAESAPPVVELNGPSDISPRLIAQALSGILGRHVEAVEVPTAQWEAQVANFGLSPAGAALLLELYRGVNSGRIAYEFPDTVRRGSTPLETTLGELVR
jgi:uncharacterized protein YbjT (DUF2867 family)